MADMDDISKDLQLNFWVFGFLGSSNYQFSKFVFLLFSSNLVQFFDDFSN